jgi:RNA polymerase sigma-70 factor (ECF subfamily)
MTTSPDRLAAEERFRSVFAHLGAVAAYAQRRGHADADAAAAEVMTIAWRRLEDVPRDDPRPWLFATARNVVLADRRRARRMSPPVDLASDMPGLELDAELESALRALSYVDREALLLVAWEDLTPSQAARSLGISPAAFRVRLLRARRRLQGKLNDAAAGRRCEPNSNLDMETT